MKTQLTESETLALLPNITRVLETGEAWKDDNLHHPAGAIIDAVLKMQGMSKNEKDEDSSEGFATNGWQYDWWQSLTYKGKDYVLSGSGYYGGHSFALADE